MIPLACLAASPLSAQESATTNAVAPLPEVPEAMPPTVITGTRTERALSEVPIRTEIITIHGEGVGAAPKLAEALELTTGLRVESTCQNCNSSEVQMLGLPQRYSAILTDGMPIFSSLAGIYGIEQIPTEFVDRIEVVKGGGSALYGPSAVAGLINLIPREPDYPGGGVNLRYTLMEGDRSGDRPSLDGTLHGTVATKDRTLGVRVFGINSYLQALDVNGDNLSEISRRDLWAGGFRSLWRPREGMKLTLDYLHSSEDRRGGSDGDALDEPENAVEITEATTTRQHLGTIIFQHQTNPRFDYRLGFSAVDVSRDSYYGGTAALGSPDPASPYYDPTWTAERGFGETANRMYVADALANWKATDVHTLSLGLQWRDETLEDFQPTVNRVQTDHYENFGVVVQAESEWTEKLATVVSGRVDWHSELPDPELSGRLAARYALRDTLRFRASLGTGFRAPEVFNEDFHITNIGGALQNVVSADGLQAEHSVTANFGPEWQIGGPWSVDVNGFHTWLSDTFVVEAADDPSTVDVLEYQRVNGGDSRVFGAEFNLNFSLKPVRATLGYVEQRLEYGEPQLLLGDPDLADPRDNPVFTGRYPRVPERYGVLRFDWDLRVVEFSLAGKLTGPMDVPHVVTDAGGNLVRNELTRSDWFFTLDLALIKRWNLQGRGQLTATVGVQNLFNDYQDDLDSGPFRDSTYVYGPRYPRTAYASLSYAF
jgi:outer membrane receptor for ferrienterochelin and colicins